MCAIDGLFQIALDQRDPNGQNCKQLKLYCADGDAFEAWKESFEWVFNKDLMVCYILRK